MPDSEIRVLSIPFHKDALAKIESRMNEEFDKVKQPVVIEAYVHSIVLNWLFNVETQRLGEEKQKEIQRQLRTDITIWSNTNLQALKK